MAPKKSRGKSSQSNTSIFGLKLKVRENSKVKLYCKMCSLIDFQLTNASRVVLFIISYHLTPIQATMIEKICPFCEEVFDEDLIKDHIGINHLGLESGAFHSSNDENTESSLDCKDCDKKLTSESDLKIHENIVHPIFKFTCDKCDKRFLFERSVNLHQKVVHSNQGSAKTNETILLKKELREQSPKHNNSKSDSMSNKSGIHQGRKFKCEQCPKHFSVKSHLKRHITLVHQGILKFKCHDCPRRFSCQANMKIHVKGVHKKIKDLQCEYCKKSFSRKWSLNVHKITHSKIRDRMNCSKCDKTFVSETTLKVHIKMVHDKIKDQQCEHCLNVFLTKSELKRHMITHSDRRIKCSKCENTFASKETLKIHMKMVHEKIKNFKCENCSKSFFAKSDLKRHISFLVHSKKIDNKKISNQ